MIHALFGAHLADRPIIGTTADGIEADEAHPLVIEGPIRLAEELPPLLAHIQVPVVLAGDEIFLGLDLVEDPDPELQLFRLAELRQVPAENQEVGSRAHGLNFFRGPRDLVDETGVDRLRVEMSVGDPGELERFFGRVSDVDRVDQRPPAERLAHGGGAEQTRFVQEGAAGQTERWIGTHAGLLEHRGYLTSFALKIGHAPPPSIAGSR